MSVTIISHVDQILIFIVIEISIYLKSVLKIRNMHCYNRIVIENSLLLLRTFYHYLYYYYVLLLLLSLSF